MGKGQAGLWPPPPWREVFRGRRGRLTAGLLLLEALGAVETLIVTTIMPAVLNDLGAIQLYGWAFSASALATFATIPIAGRATDRFGPRKPLGLSFVVYIAGLVLSGIAPSMLVLVLGRFFQGCAGGVFFSVSLGTVAKSYPEELRPRALALLASMWILPGLVGPPLGALLASTVGWRWAFIGPIPFMALAGALILLSMREVRIEPDAKATFQVRWPVQLMAGAGLLLAGLTELSLWSLVLVPAGIAIGLRALARITPPGTFRARTGLPAAAMAAFLLSAAYGATEGFVPLMLTSVRHLSVGKASIILILVATCWAVGSWWQSRQMQRLGPVPLVVIGAAMVAVGIAGGATALVSGPIAVPYVAWSIAGVGMGIAFPTIPLAVMGQATAGNEASQLSSTLLMATLGTGIGAGLGGASIAIAKNAGAGIGTGLAGAFAVGLVAVLALILVARRLPRGAG